ncbi:hypothetical protein DSO57_1029460 [Entomophthora muscae]|uniref:Uncharacterized protein n=1 Tax=Entomophthora muscae TaxID=34485 RepID=A0ACC2T135_9FUNG|nr:hypothetical protein DSO57_1029460 [Entomophthora muscae]
MQFTLLLSLLSLCLASKFGTDLRAAKGSVCASSKVTVDKRFPKLKKCFQNSSLFFSTIHSVCRPECRNVTISASSYIVKKCRLGKPGKKSPVLANKHLSYSAWSDKQAVNIVCARSYHRNVCLSDFTQASFELKPRKDYRSPRKHCTKCNNRIFHKFKKNPYAIPSVYYQTVKDPADTLKRLGSVCGWH